MLNIGCVSTVTDGLNTAYHNTRTTLNKIGGEDRKTDELYAQVKPKDRERIDDLSHQLEVTQQKRELAKLEKKRDDLKRDRSRTNDKMMELLTREQEHRVKLAKLEAIDRNRLGDKITNIELIADTHVDALEVQQKRLQLEGDVSILDVKISELDEQITSQQNKIDELTKQG
jgi:predicted  nucleic acid-binding Zn-ribbon protein